MGDSFLSRAGSMTAMLVKHVVWRGFLWGVIGLILGSVCAVLSFVLGVKMLGRGSEILAFALAVPFFIVAAGSFVFALHGMQRGVAQAALSLERELGLVRHVTGRITGLVEGSLGPVVKNLSLADFRDRVRDAASRYLKEKDEETRGLGAWVGKKIKKIVVKRAQTYITAGYEASLKAGLFSEGVSLTAISEGVASQISGKLRSIVFSPLNTQLAILTILYVALAGGWWYWLFLILKLFIRSEPSS